MSPTGPKIRYVDPQVARAQVDGILNNMHRLIEKYVYVGGVCELRATLPDGQQVAHKFSIPKRLDYRQVDAYIAVESDYLEHLIQEAKQRGQTPQA